MKIVHLIASMDRGGAEHTLYKLISFDNLNKHIVISLTKVGVYGQKLKKKNIEVYDSNLNKNFFLNLLKIYNILKKIKLVKPNIIQSWMYHADFLALIFGSLLKIKFFWNIRNSNLNKKWSNFFTIFLLKINAYFSCKPYKIISCSKNAILFHGKHGYLKKKFYLIENGFNGNYYKSNNKLKKNFKKKYNIKNNIIIGMIARWHPQKGHNLLLQGLKKILRISKYQNIKLVLAGPGMTIKNYELIKILRKNLSNDKYLLLGDVDDLRMVYNACDLTVLPSIGNEGFPNVVAESMLCETPVIASNSGDVKKIIKNNDFVIKPGNQKQLINSLNKNLNDILFKKKKKKIN